MGYLGIYVLFINLWTLLVFAVDKRKAINGKWRVPEKTLFILAILGGSLGALAGMYLFHHKTKKFYFVAGMPVILTLQITAAMMMK